MVCWWGDVAVAIEMGIIIGLRDHSNARTAVRDQIRRISIVVGEVLDKICRSRHFEQAKALQDRIAFVERKSSEVK